MSVVTCRRPHIVGKGPEEGRQLRPQCPSFLSSLFGKQRILLGTPHIECQGCHSFLRTNVRCCDVLLRTGVAQGKADFLQELRVLRGEQSQGLQSVRPPPLPSQGHSLPTAPQSPASPSCTGGRERAGRRWELRRDRGARVPGARGLEAESRPLRCARGD